MPSPTLPPLTPEQQIKPVRFELRMALIFATVLAPNGVHLPYFPVWLEANGFRPEQIGVILAAPMFLRVVTTPLITAFADTAKDRANVLIVLVACSLALSLGYLVTPSYVLVLAISLLLALFWTPQSSLADSLALSGVRRFGSSYANMRIWGSISFLIASLAGGYILAATSVGAVPVIISAGLAVALGTVVFAPRLGRPRLASPLSAASIQQSAPKLLNRYFVLFVTGAGVIVASHGFLYGFVSIYWKSIGLSDGLIGVLWAWSVVAEVGMFIIFSRVFGKMSVGTMMVIAGGGAILRWVIFPLIWPAGLGVPGFFAAQTLHALSTALNILGLQKLIAETVAEHRMGAAQGIAYFANNLCMAAVTLISGPIYNWMGVDGFYVMAGVALIGIAFVVVAARSAPERRLRR